MTACTCKSVPDREHGTVRVLNVDCPTHGEEADARRKAKQ